MKRMLVAAACVAATLFARAAEEKFSRSIPAGDFSAARLARLPPEELARLDALIRDDQGGARGEARDGREGQGRRGSGGEESRGQPAGTRQGAAHTGRANRILDRR